MCAKRDTAAFGDYLGFVEKFQPKKTTDDCYTPGLVYNAVLAWAAREYGIGGQVVRPFYPGGDYEAFDYPEGCTVVDNPPFSILAQIVRFYQERGIRFFLFAPGLTTFMALRTEGVCAVCADAIITYESDATVRTNFLTNMDARCRARSTPGLFIAVKEAMEEVNRGKARELPKYNYPDEVLTTARLNWMSAHSVAFEVPTGECELVQGLDAQRPLGKSIFGGGCSFHGAQPQSAQPPPDGSCRPANGGCRNRWGRRFPPFSRCEMLHCGDSVNRPQTCFTGNSPLRNVAKVMQRYGTI